MPEPANRKARDWAGCRTKACILLSLHNPGIRENCSFTSKQHSASGGAVPPGSCFDLHLPLSTQMADELEKSAQAMKKPLPEHWSKKALKGQRDTCSKVPLAGPELRTTRSPQPKADICGLQMLAQDSAWCTCSATSGEAHRLAFYCCELPLEPALQQGGVTGGAWRSNILLPTRRCTACVWS